MDASSPLIGNAYLYNEDSREEIKTRFGVPDFPEEYEQELYGQYLLKMPSINYEIFISAERFEAHFNSIKDPSDDYTYQIEPKNMDEFRAMYLA